jgi:hypothetical protein
MTVTAKVLAEGQVIPSTNTTVYTAPAYVTTIIDKLTTANYDVVARQITINIVASGNSVGNAYYIGTQTLGAGETYTWPEVVGQILSTGDYVVAAASNNTGVNLRMSGREIT